MRDNLIGYLLGAIDDDESARIDAQLKIDPQLRRELRLAANSLRPLQCDADDVEPPPCLAHATCDFVQAAIRAARRMEWGHTPVWTLVDVTIAAMIFMAVCLLFFPAVNNSRFHASTAGCQNNLRSIGQALAAYSENAQGMFPSVPASGNLAVAGIYAATLRDAGLIAHDQIVLCPASVTALEIEEFSIPSCEEIQQARGQELGVRQHWLGGTYGYIMGYVKAGTLYGVRNQSRTHFPIMSDAPDETYFCGGMSAHSQSRPQPHRNVLFEFGGVRQVPSRCNCWQGDSFFVNDYGQVAAGAHAGDAVIASSGTSPLVLLDLTIRD